MAKFKKLAMLTMALLASATLAAAVGCDGEESSSSSPAPAPGPAPITYETAKGILPNVVSVAANETVYYKYTATVDGSVSTTAYGDVDVIVNGGKSALVNKGDEVVIEVSGKDGKAVENATWYVKEGDGSSDNAPLVLSEACEFDATITWNEDGYYNDFYAVFVPAEYNMYMVMLEQVGDDEIEGLTINSNPAEYAFGVWKDVYPGSEESLTLSIATPDEIPEGTTPADVTVSLKGYVAPLKTPEIQPTIVEVEDSTAIYAEYYYEIDEYTIFKYTPAKDGVVTFTAPYGGEIIALLDLDSILANKEPEFYLDGEDYLEFPATAGVPVYFMVDECHGPLVVMYEDREYVEPVVVPDGTSTAPYAATAGTDITTNIETEGQQVFYSYTATELSTLKFTSNSADFFILNWNTENEYVQGNYALDTDVVLEKDQTITFAITSYTVGEYTWKFTVTAGVEPNGTMEYPYAITSGTAVTSTFDYNTYSWTIYAYTATADGTITFMCDEENVPNVINTDNRMSLQLNASYNVKAGETITFLVQCPMDDSWNYVYGEYDWSLVFTANATGEDMVGRGR